MPRVLQKKVIVRIRSSPNELLLMKYSILLRFFWVFLGFTSNSVLALPDLNLQEQILGVTVMRDRTQGSLFYAYPKGVGVVQLEDGGPDIALRVARYTGSKVREDSGAFDIHSALHIGLKVEQYSKQEMGAMERALRRKYGATTMLRPTPISSVSAKLIHAADPQNPQVLDTNNYDEAYYPQASRQGWSERRITLRFDESTADIIEQQLQNGLLAISLQYGFSVLAWGAGSDVGDVQITGSDELATQIEDELQEQPDDSALSNKPSLQDILADAFVLVVPEAYRENRFKRYDIDASLPPSYPSLAIFCFLFKNNQMQDLFRRTVEIEASGAAGGKTLYSADFDLSNPSKYAETVRFSYAVDIAKPFRWRTMDIYATGRVARGEWEQSQSWVDTINVSYLESPDTPVSDN